MRIGNLIIVDINCSGGTFGSWETWTIGSSPKPAKGDDVSTVCLAQMKDSSYTPVQLLFSITSDGKLCIINKSGAQVSIGWLFLHIAYVCV